MLNISVRVEQPKAPGEEAEFFHQSAPPYTSSCTAHIHNAIELLYVDEGSYRVTLDNTEYLIGKGDLILFCSGAIHHVRSEGCERNGYFVIKIPPSFFIDLAKNGKGTEYAMRFAVNRKENRCLWKKEELCGSSIQSILDALTNEYSETGYASEVAIKLKIMELMLSILREGAAPEGNLNDRTSELIYNVMSYVKTNYADDIDEQELARKSGVSYSYFSRSFKRVTGMTFRTYLNRTRINKAEQHLFKNGGSISEAATACGYNSISYFISVYRSVTGKTPYQALKSSKEANAEIK